MASVAFSSSTMLMGSATAIAGNVRLRPVATRRAVTCAVSKREPRSVGGGGGGRGITRPRPISPAMQKFLGVSEIPRTSAIKKIWEYIKEHNLQDPANKKEIICDERLKSIFGGRERVGFLEISGLMNPHFIKAE